MEEPVSPDLFAVLLGGLDNFLPVAEKALVKLVSKTPACLLWKTLGFTVFDNGMHNF